MENKTGQLIVIEGIDGSGKATQTKKLVEKIQQLGLAVANMDFPQYEKNFFGGMVRQYLDGKFGDPITIDPHLASVLYAADRWESSKTINDWLAAGKTVILDRYYTSNLIHQSAKLEETKIDEFINWVEKMELETFKIPKPDAVIYLHVNAEASYDLISKRGNGHDGHDKLNFMKIAEKRCRYLAQKLNWQIIECCKDNTILGIDEIADLVWQKAEKIIKD